MHTTTATHKHSFSPIRNTEKLILQWRRLTVRLILRSEFYKPTSLPHYTVNFKNVNGNFLFIFILIEK